MAEGFDAAHPTEEFGKHFFVHAHTPRRILCNSPSLVVVHSTTIVVDRTTQQRRRVTVLVEQQVLFYLQRRQ
jgi:hypothetical protein